MSWMIILLIFHSIRWLWLHVCGYSYLWWYTRSDVISYRFRICPISGYTVFVIYISNNYFFHFLSIIFIKSSFYWFKLLSDCVNYVLKVVDPQDWYILWDYKHIFSFQRDRGNLSMYLEIQAAHFQNISVCIDAVNMILNGPEGNFQPWLP